MTSNPIRQKPWPTYDKGVVFVDEADTAAVEQVLRERRLFRYDDRPYQQTYAGQFELSLQERFGVPYALALSSGTSALTLALLALELPPDTAVGCTTFTFTATPSAIIQARCCPLLVNVDENLLLDLEDLERNLPKMGALVVVHMRGYAERIETIMDMANKYGVPVVEDAVPSLGLKVSGRYVGTWGRFGTFSTQSDKSLNSGEGGFLLCHDKTDFQHCVVMSGAFENRWQKHFKDTHALDPALELRYPLFNFRIDEIRAALLLSQLDKLDIRLKRMRQNYDYLRNSLAEFSSIRLRKPGSPNAVLGDYLMFRLEGASIETTIALASALRSEGISARALGDTSEPNVRRFWDWRYLFPEQDVKQIQASFPRSTKMLSRMIDIPLSPLLELDDLQQLVIALRKSLQKIRN